MRRYVILLVIMLLGIGCEDNKTQPKVNPNPSVIDTLKTTSPEPEKVEEIQLGTPKNPFMPGQADVKPFLKTYGEENKENRVRIETRFGNIELELYTDTPLHRANFILLVKEGYFDLTQFHRVSPAFVVQGGNDDTYSVSKKRSSMGKYLLPNEAKSKYKHRRGALAAAKFVEQNISNASSPFEFYIVQPRRGAHHLNGDHTVFGRVTKGMDVVDKINEVAIDQSDWPLEDIPIKMVIIED